MCNITLIQKLLIYFLSANHIDVIGIILFQFPVQLFHGMHDNRIFNLIRRIMCQHNIGAVFQRKTIRKTLQRLSSHHDNFPGCCLAEKFLIHRNPYQKLIIFSNCPIFIYCCNDIHNFLLPDCYIATGMFLICGPVT